MVTQGMIYLLDVKNRLAAIAKDMSIVSNQQSAISNQQWLLPSSFSTSFFCST
jgi:hypothetical protein